MLEIDYLGPNSCVTNEINCTTNLKILMVIEIYLFLRIMPSKGLPIFFREYQTYTNIISELSPNSPTKKKGVGGHLTIM